MRRQELWIGIEGAIDYIRRSYRLEGRIHRYVGRSNVPAMREQEQKERSVIVVCVRGQRTEKQFRKARAERTMELGQFNELDGRQSRLSI